MKKTTILLSSVLLLSLSGVVAAQNGRGHKDEKRAKMTPEQREAKHAERSKKRLAKLTEKLSLTPAQVVKAKKIFADKKNSMKHLRDAGDDKRSPEMREARRQLRTETKAKMNAMLSAEQREVFSTLKHRGKKGIRGHHGRKGECGDKANKRRGNRDRDAKNGRKGKRAKKVKNAKAK